MRSFRSFTIGVGCLFLIAAPVGCVLAPGSGDNNGSNADPVANAGADQTVARNASVQLNGSASSDPDGDALTFLWTQTGGPAVSLSDASAAQPQFTAPGTSATLTFDLKVDDAKGGTATDSLQVLVEGARGTIGVVNNDSGRITLYDINDLDGEVEPFSRIDAGATTSVFQPRSIVITPGGATFISRQNGGIAFFGDNLSPAGNVPAAAVLEGAATKLDAPISMALDTNSELLFVGNAPAANGILVFDASDINGGNVAPLRSFAPPDRAPFNSLPMTVDALWLHAGELFVSDTSGNNANSSRILVFPDAVNASGQVTPVRQITSSSFGNIEDLTVTDSGVLLVVDGTNTVKVFNQAASANGNLAPDRVITISGTPTPSLQGVAVSIDGVGYLADRENSAIYSIGDIANANGVVTPAATLSGFNTRLAGPRQIFVISF
ncbi:MAG: PKD domain-containing protein [Phycisphaerae bacterium]|nr:PKD domain-containing protein [Phycisphaerae bacterium]